MLKITKVFLLVLNIMMICNVPTRANTMEEQSVFAALVLNVIRFTTWPEGANLKEKIDLCVVGDNLVQESFASIDGKKAGNKFIHIISLSRLRNFNQCNVLYISGLEQNVLLQVLSEIRRHPLLTIGEGFGFVEQGGMFSLENVDGKVIMHLNLAVARESKMEISSRLIMLSKVFGK